MPFFFFFYIRLANKRMARLLVSDYHSYRRPEVQEASQVRYRPYPRPSPRTLALLITEIQHDLLRTVLFSHDLLLG